MYANRQYEGSEEMPAEGTLITLETLILNLGVRSDYGKSI
jgi:hypothetical protein